METMGEAQAWWEIRSCYPQITASSVAFVFAFLIFVQLDFQLTYESSYENIIIRMENHQNILILTQQAMI